MWRRRPMSRGRPPRTPTTAPVVSHRIILRRQSGRAGPSWRWAPSVGTWTIDRVGLVAAMGFDGVEGALGHLHQRLRTVDLRVTGVEQGVPRLGQSRGHHRALVGFQAGPQPPPTLRVVPARHPARIRLGLYRILGRFGMELVAGQAAPQLGNGGQAGQIGRLGFAVGGDVAGHHHHLIDGQLSRREGGHGDGQLPLAAGQRHHVTGPTRGQARLPGHPLLTGQDPGALPTTRRQHLRHQGHQAGVGSVQLAAHLAQSRLDLRPIHTNKRTHRVLQSFR